MKTTTDLALRSLRFALPLLLLSTPNLQLSTAFAQGTAFTNQGRLNDAGAPANGSYDLLFRVYDAPTGLKRSREKDAEISALKERFTRLEAALTQITKTKE